ncbi:MAG TPA: hypothetical protein VEX68_10710 [Bryobacteraceae bacterium]|nr:hypothetical protein [Bryobacteraceae bacterium]
MMLFFLLVTAAVLTGCGYVGDPLPPALNIPVSVEDLRVIQRGDKLVLEYTAPSLTTEALVLTHLTSAEALIGDRTVAIETPKVGQPAHIELPAGQWAGRDVGVSIKLSGPKGRQSAASNVVTLRVVEPLPSPAAVKAQLHPEGIRVSWTGSGVTGEKYRVMRVPDAAAVVDKSEFIDRAVELGKDYRYSVVAVVGAAESLPSSASETVTARDAFPPAVPVNLTAIAGVGSIELGWDRGLDADLKNYRVYRNDQAIGDSDAPSFSDRQIKTGERYRYTLTAIDQAGNESARSAIVEIVAP